MAGKKSKTKGKVVEKTQEELNNERILAFFKNREEFHYNFEEPVDYCVSSGSLFVDSELLGFGPGFHRFFGPTESGKTSEALTVMNNMFKEVKGSKGFFVKAEGRLSKKMMERSGITFVTDPLKWVAGTCLLFKCNISEVVYEFIDGLIAKSKYDDGTKLCGILDSTDGLITEAASKKNYGESAQIAGGAVQASHFAKVAALPAGERGHMLIILSQIREKIKASQYAPADKQKKAGGSGGNALMHYPDHIWEFLNPTQSDMFVKDGGEANTAHFLKNPIIGHNVRFKTLKTPNEKTNMVFEYPIKYNRTEGKSIWVEKEVIDFLLGWGYIEKKGSWFNFGEELVLKIKEFEESSGEEVIFEKCQGMNNLNAALEARPKLIQFLIDFAKEQIEDNL